MSRCDWWDVPTNNPESLHKKLSALEVYDSGVPAERTARCNDVECFSYQNFTEFLLNMREKHSGSTEFGKIRNQRVLRSIFTKSEQDVFGKKLYPTTESRVVFIFYELIKQHPFVDGNKRIAATFLYATRAHMGVTLNRAMCAALFVAGSVGEDRDSVIGFIEGVI